MLYQSDIKHCKQANNRNLLGLVPLKAKLKITRTGISRAGQDLLVEKILIERNSATIIIWIRDGMKPCQIHHLFYNIWSSFVVLSIHHVLQDVNSMTDWVALLSISKIELGIRMLTSYRHFRIFCFSTSWAALISKLYKCRSVLKKKKRKKKFASYYAWFRFIMQQKPKFYSRYRHGKDGLWDLHIVMVNS